MKKTIRLTESDLIGIIKKVISEQSDHVKNLYKSWSNKKSGDPEKALSIMDDVFKYQKQLSKKDFSQYSSYDELKKDIDRIKSEEKLTDTTKFYEDNDLLVLAANTWESSCKYGAGSKWCTTMKNDDSYWDRHNKTGTEFFWIFKNKSQKDPNHKFSYHIKANGETPDWCDAVNNCRKDLPPNSSPKQHPKYNEILNKLQEFHNSRKFEQYKSRFEINEEIINQSLVVYIKEYIKTNINDFSKKIKSSFITEVKYALNWRGGTKLISKVLNLGKVTYVKGSDEIINNKIKDFIENKFKNENLLKYINFENLENRVASDLKYVVFRVLEKNGISIQKLLIPQLEEKGLEIKNIISKLPNREFEESINENIEYSNVFTEIIDKEMYEFVESNIDEFKKFIK